VIQITEPPVFQYLVGMMYAEARSKKSARLAAQFAIRFKPSGRPEAMSRN
jgi:hypothetical protein